MINSPTTEPLPTASSAHNAPIKLLVSVRDVVEAQIAFACGVRWIDLKNPDNGPLGAPHLDVARSVANFLSNTLSLSSENSLTSENSATGEYAELPAGSEQSSGQRSVALGELATLDIDLADELAKYFPVLKLGLSGMQREDDWRSRFDEIRRVVAKRNATLVPVVYADWPTCSAPPPEDIAAYARRIEARFLLIDTYEKNGKTLLDWMHVEQIAGLISEMSSANCGVVVAGSITEKEAAQLLHLSIAAIGIRGAVCQGDRNSSISAEKVRSWVRRITSP